MTARWHSNSTPAPAGFQRNRTRPMRRSRWRESIREIQQALGEVNPMTLEEWEEAFQMEFQPEREIACWLEVARRYVQWVARCGDLPLAQRKEQLHRLVLEQFAAHVG